MQKAETMTQKTSATCLCFVVLAFASATSSAADVFTVPSASEVAAAGQEARIARLETMLKSTMSKLAKPEQSESGDEPPKPPAGARPPIPTPIPSPIFKAGIPPGGYPAPSAEPEDERVLGTMNGQEIYVLGGVVRKRAIPTTATQSSTGSSKR